MQVLRKQRAQQRYVKRLQNQIAPHSPTFVDGEKRKGEGCSRKYDSDLFEGECVTMTDEKIVKGFECCMRPPKCDDCPFRIDPHKCKDIMEKAVLDLINRQKAEIERLKAELREADLVQDEEQQEHEKWLEYQKKLFAEMVSVARAEAIKEFAERLKATYGEWLYDYRIDDLVKEMVGDNNG